MHRKQSCGVPDGAMALRDRVVPWTIHRKSDHRCIEAAPPCVFERGVDKCQKRGVIPLMRREKAERGRINGPALLREWRCSQLGCCLVQKWPQRANHRGERRTMVWRVAR